MGEYFIINPYTSQGAYVEVTYVPPGEQIQSIPSRAASGALVSASPVSTGSYGSSLGSMEFVTKALNVQGTDGKRISPSSRLGGEYISTAGFVSGNERLQLEAIIAISREWVFIKPQNGSSYFASFSEAQSNQAAVDQLIRVAHTTNNPAWVNQQLSIPLVTSLLRTLESFWGKGVGGCILMDNGDVGCWQINLLAHGAGRLIEGTAKDKNGNPLSAGGSEISGGGGGGVEVIPNSPSPGYTSYNFGVYQYRCGYVNNQLSNCAWILLH